MKICEPSQCTGCGICGHNCPVQAISYPVCLQDGFRHPVIDEELCTECGLCRRQCPQNTAPQLNAVRNVYAAFAKQEEVRQKSSSGGLATLLAESVLAHKGVVYGAAYADDFSSVLHLRVTDPADLFRIQGSKYVESSLSGIYPAMEQDLAQGRDVLFVGLPCQCDAVRKQFGRSDTLFLIDLLCSGTPSAYVFEQHTSYMKQRYASDIVHVIMREKSRGWNNIQASIDFENGRRYRRPFLLDPYTQGYSKRLFIRDCCATCRFCTDSRPGDITLGDFWGIGNTAPYAHSSRSGVSAVLVNTQKGETLLNTLRDRIVCDERSLDEVKVLNKPLHTPSGHHADRQHFMDDLVNHGYPYVVKRHLGSRLFYHKAKIKRWLRTVRGRLHRRKGQA